MLCQKCHKKNATVHLTEIVGNEKKEVHLCEECARDKGIGIKAQFSMADILSGLISAPVGKELAKLSKVSCPECGLSYINFHSAGRLGCAHDYKVFGELLTPLIRRIHGGTRHVGKVPPHVGKQVVKESKLLRLRRALRDAVQKEQYEEAARIRDEIKTIEEGKREG
jgi:protein arginine kinase activator